MNDGNATKKTKLLIISQCFYPSVSRGGPAVSVTNLAKALADQMEVSVITASYEGGTGETFSEIHEGKNRLFGCDVYYLRQTAASVITQQMQKISPDVLYISSLFSAEYTLPALRYAKKHHIKTVLAPRGELQPNALCRKSFKKKVYLLMLRCLGLTNKLVFHATSEEEKKAIQKLFPKAVVFTAHNLALPRESGPRTRNKKAGELHAVAVCRVHPIKGLDKGIAALQSLRGSVTYDIYGPIEDEAYFKQCQKIAAALPEHIRVSFCGTAKPTEVPQLLRNADVFLLPTKTENFGNAIVEAMLHGCPAVISDATPWRNLTAAKAGADISVDSGYAPALQQLADLPEADWMVWSDGARAYIQNALNSQASIQTYLQMLEG